MKFIFYESYPFILPKIFFVSNFPLYNVTSRENFKLDIELSHLNDLVPTASWAQLGLPNV